MKFHLPLCPQSILKQTYRNIPKIHWQPTMHTAFVSVAVVVSLLTSQSFAQAQAQSMNLCDVYAGADFINNGFAAGASQLPAGTFSMTADAASYTPGQVVTLQMTGPSMNMLMLYANPKDQLSARVGSFAMPAGFQSNAGSCGGFTMETQNAVLASIPTTSAISGTQTFQWTAPAQSFGELHMNMMVLTQAGTGWAYQIVPCIIIIKCAGTIAPAPAVILPVQNCPPPIVQTVIQKEIQTVVKQAAPVTVVQKQIVTVQAAPVTVIQRQMVTVTQKVMVTQQVIQIQQQLQIRKCKPRLIQQPTVVVVQPAVTTPKAAVKPVVAPPVVPCCGGTVQATPVVVKPVVAPVTPCCQGEIVQPVVQPVVQPPITPCCGNPIVEPVTPVGACCGGEIGSGGVLPPLTNQLPTYQPPTPSTYQAPAPIVAPVATPVVAQTPMATPAASTPAAAPIPAIQAVMSPAGNATPQQFPASNVDQGQSASTGLYKPLPDQAPGVFNGQPFVPGPTNQNPNQQPTVYGV
ncbi:hypothetical protein BC830DRAFT_1114734 [Chytriomyces sp. MP71]|nr:hypothetical protein BC830DRAFT_1114734 [Chytriomyces sp. MP71]